MKPTLKELEEIAIEAVKEKKEGNLFYILEPKESRGFYRITENGLVPLEKFNLNFNNNENIWLVE